MLLSIHCSRTEVVNKYWTTSTLNFVEKGYFYIKDHLHYHEDGCKLKLGKMYSEERITFFFYLLSDNCWLTQSILQIEKHKQHLFQHTNFAKSLYKCLR